MTPDIFDLVALVIIFLCYCAGRYWLGPYDAKKASIKHDGRRAAYRGGILALVLAFIVWRTTYGVWPAALTWGVGCLAGSIGVRLGWNAARGLDWRYLGSTSADDRWFLKRVMGKRFDANGHYSLYEEIYSYHDQVNRAGLIRTIVEGSVSVGGYALILFA